MVHPEMIQSKRFCRNVINAYSREGTSSEDRDASLILTKIQQLGGETTAGKLKDRIAKYTVACRDFLFFLLPASVASIILSFVSGVHRQDHGRLSTVRQTDCRPQKVTPNPTGLRTLWKLLHAPLTIGERH
jgi:hypothetical protein